MQELINFYTNAPEGTGWIFAVFAVWFVVCLVRPRLGFVMLKWTLWGVFWLLIGILVGRFVGKKIV